MLNNLKKRLEASKRRWLEELHEVLWAYRTMTMSSTGETSLSLIYGSEALIQVEMEQSSLRFAHATEESSAIELDFLNRQWEIALIRMASQKQRIEKCYNKMADLWTFKMGDYVLQNVLLATQEPNAGKLLPN